MKIALIGSVSGEGGPLLVADAVSAKTWSGAEGADYQRACEPFDNDGALEGVELPLGGVLAIAWEMAGAGTADVYRVDDGGFMIVRYWLADPRSADERRSLAAQPLRRGTSLGRVQVRSGFACVTWAAVSGEDIAVGAGATGRSIIANADGTSVAFPLAPGKYECIHDSVASGGGGRARRCHIRPMPPH